MTACGVCGTPCRPPFRAPAAELAPDLDGRPGEPARATLRRWVQVCRGCGAAAPDLAALTPAMAEIVRGRAVQEEANPFLRWAALIEATDGDAGEALLQAAWLVEDEGGDAAGLRRLAAAAWRGDGLRKLDILRRAGAFEEALSWAESLGPLDEAAQAIVAFQRGCIARGDAGRHDLGSALRPPARRPHAAHGQKAERPRLGVFGRLFGRQRVARGAILAVRHPRPRTGARVCLGRMDAPLAEPATAGAEKVMEAIGEETRIERIISSPLQRAWGVAEVLARWSGAALHADDRLTEQDFGAWTGQAWASLPAAAVARWAADRVGEAPGGSESGAAMLRRVRHAWHRLASAEETTLVVTHAGPVQCLLHIAGGLPLAAALERSVAYGEVVTLD